MPKTRPPENAKQGNGVNDSEEVTGTQSALSSSNDPAQAPCAAAKKLV